jgi:hypothetical protein
VLTDGEMGCPGRRRALSAPDETDIVDDRVERLQHGHVGRHAAIGDRIVASPPLGGDRFRRRQTTKSAVSGTADDVVELLRQLRLPYMRRHAPYTLATAKA